MRDVLVTIHASGGIAGLIVGLGVLVPPRTVDDRKWLRRLYVLSLAVLLGGLVVLVATDWGSLETGTRLAFSGLTGLAGVMGYRILLAQRLVHSREQGWESRYIGHVYFTYISLWVGFLIVPALNTASPEIWVPVTVVGVLTVGALLINRFKKRMAETSYAKEETTQ